MPAAGELNAIYGNGNMGVLNTALGKIGGTKLSTSYHWSSSEGPSGDAWSQRFDNGLIFNDYAKDYSFYVRPVIAF